jgi:hypothetical protein
MLKEIVINSYHNYERKIEFNNEANIVASSFSQELRQLQYNSGSIEKFELNLTSRIIGKEVVISEWLLRKQHIFNFDEYWSLSKEERPLFLLVLLKDHLVEAAITFQWDTLNIVNVSNMLVENGIKREAHWIYEAHINAYKILVFYSLKRNSMEVFFEFFNESNVSVRKILIAKLWPNDYYLNQLLGEIKVEGEGVTLISVDNNFRIKLNFMKNTITYHGFKPTWLNEV